MYPRKSAFASSSLYLLPLLPVLPLLAHRPGVQAQGAAATADGRQAAENRRDDAGGGGEAAEGERLCEFTFCSSPINLLNADSYCT